MTLGDRICVMNGGKVAQVGTPIEVYQRPANLFVARFLGAPPMNVVGSTVAMNGGRPVGRIGEATVPLDRFAHPGGEVLLGFRPEAAQLSNARPDDIAIPGTVKLVERLGAETVTTVTIADDIDVLLRNPGDKPAAIGERIRLHVAAGDLYAFDPQSGAAIATRG
jgi:ABC-type sugar transport system ATPase subunit